MSLQCQCDSNCNMLEIKRSQIMGKGSGSAGCLLNLTLKDEPQFTDLPLQFQIRELSLSGSFAVCIDQHNNLHFWGTLYQAIIQKPLLLHTKVKAMSCGWNHFMFTTQKGLWGMGHNANLELGVPTQGKFVSQPLLLKQQTPQNFVCGFRQSYFITESQLWGCGESKKYELGVSEKDAKEWRVLWQRGKNENQKIIEMRCGKRFVLMLSEQGRVWALGSNQQNAFNKLQLTHTVTPMFVWGGIRQIECGWAHTVLLDHKGGITTFGRNNLGQLGRKESAQVQLQLKQGEKVARIVSGTQFAFAVTSQGRVFGWGWNEHANITNSNQSVLPVPTLLELPAPCLRLWTCAATTIIELKSASPWAQTQSK